MKSSVLACLLMLLPLLLPAQSDSTKIPAGVFERMELYNPWLNSSNPAAHEYDPPSLQAGRLGLSHDAEAGDYRRVMQGDSLRAYRFSTEKYRRINRTALYGLFSYERSFEQGSRFSEVENPYRVTPYLLIDTMAQNEVTDREFFSLKGDVSAPLLPGLYWGLSAGLDVGLASQDRDPRPANKLMRLGLSPGLLYKGETLQLGVNGLFSYYNEDIEVDIIRKNTQLAFFQLHGFNSYTYHVAASYNRLYKAGTAGGEGQLNLSFRQLKSLFIGRFLYFRENADDGRKAGDATWSFVKNDSKLEGNKMLLQNLTTLHRPGAMHRLSSSYSLHYMVGAEIMQRLEQVGDLGAVDWVDYGEEEKYAASLSKLGFDYRFLRLREEYRPLYGLEIGLHFWKQKRAYYLPDMQEGFRQALVSLAVDRTFLFGKNELELGVHIRWKQNMDSYRDYDERGFLAQKLLLPEFNYLSCDFFAPGFSLRYARALEHVFDQIHFSLGGQRYLAWSALYPGEEYRRAVWTFAAAVMF